MSTMQWYYGEANQQRGPVSTEQLHTLIQTGRITADTLLWNERMTEWQPARAVPGIGELLDGASVDPTPTPAAIPLATQSPAAQPIPIQPVSTQAPQGVLGYQTARQGGDIYCSPRGIDALRQTSPWVRLISIVLFLTAGLTVLGLFGTLIAGGSGQSGFFLMVGAIYAVVGLLYVALGIYLWRYATSIQRVLAHGQTNDLDDALAAQRSFWRLAGIIIVVVIIIYIAVFALMFFAAIFR